MVNYTPQSQVPLPAKWRHYPTYVYDKNYAYGINYYQPMIDYIDRKERLLGRRRAWDFQARRLELPELPWSDGRLLWEGTTVRPYSREDLARLAVDAENRARDHLARFKVAKRSDFSLIKTVEASRLTKDAFPRIYSDARKTPWPVLIARERARSSARSVEQQAREMAELRLQSLKDVQTMSEVQDALDHGRSLRGKSAKSIEFHLRAEALRNLSRSDELADIRKFQRDSAHLLWDDREHARLMGERSRNLIDEEKFTAPLDSLSRELKGYEQKSAHYFLDKRYRDLERLARSGRLDEYRGYSCTGRSPACV